MTVEELLQCLGFSQFLSCDLVLVVLIQWPIITKWTFFPEILKDLNGPLSINSSVSVAFIFYFGPGSWQSVTGSIPSGSLRLTWPSLARRQ